jgi:peptidoglycan hydrolase-like protein with peptidoglycan-binding domain
MAKNVRTISEKNEKLDQAHRVRPPGAHSEYDHSTASEPELPALTETSFYPHMDEHAAALSKIPLSAQRRFIMRLQRSYGNKYTEQLLKYTAAQPKLTVSQPDDIYEREADRIADIVTQKHSALEVQRDSSDEDEEVMTAPVSQLQRDSSDEEEEIQTMASEDQTVELADNLEDRINSARGGGHPLPDAALKRMERGFGVDFSAVNVHTGTLSNDLNRDLSARAFTTGKDIFFAEGEYNTGSDGGQKLLAHELTHVVQQNQAGLTQRVGAKEHPIVMDAAHQQRGEGIQRAGESIEAQPNAGTSIHPVLTFGGTNDVTAVKEFKQKLATARGENMPANPSGVFDAVTRDALTIFQRANGIKPANGIVNKATWDLLDARGQSSFGRVERDWKETVEIKNVDTDAVTSQEYELGSKYSWRIERGRMIVTVGINFVADATNPPDNLAASKTSLIKSITERWNRFKAVRKANGDSLDIIFEISDKGGNVVNVIKGTGNSDADHWFLEDMQTYPNAAAHEFGHLIGLEDEYGRPEAPYKRLNPDATAAQISGASGAQANYGGFTNMTSLMGMGALVNVDCNPEPRHLREFVKYVQKLKGGEWEAR